LIYLSGAVRPALMGRSDMGVMLTPMMGNNPDLSQTHWAADNGCFAQPQKFSLDAYLAWLQGRSRYRATCLFATAPDVVGNAAATWERSRDVLPQLRALGYPAALVAQDGMQQMTIDWDAFDVLFVGGTTAWKLSEPTYALVAEATRRGKWTHQGRVNSLRRLRACALSGFDSADGTYVAFGPDRNLPRVMDWLNRLSMQQTLWRAA
jgi:hypothetical protein